MAEAEVTCPHEEIRGSSLWGTHTGGPSYAIPAAIQMKRRQGLTRGSWLYGTQYPFHTNVCKVSSLKSMELTYTHNLKHINQCHAPT